MSINRSIISGRLTADAELRRTPGGMAILGFGVAVNDRRKNPQTGEWEDVPNYLDCVIFGSRAEKLAQYLTRGLKVAIEGKLRWSQWQDKNSGQKRSKVEIVVDEIEFMSQKGQQGGQQQGGYQQGGYQQQGMAPQPSYAAPQRQQAPNPYAQQPPAPDVFSDDIPF